MEFDRIPKRKWRQSQSTEEKQKLLSFQIGLELCLIPPVEVFKSKNETNGIEVVPSEPQFRGEQENRISKQTG